MGATINGKKIAAMHYDGQNIASAWRDGQLVWSANRMEDGISWERYFDRVTSAIEFSEYLSSRDMVTTTQDWSFQGAAKQSALHAYPQSPFDGPVAFMSDAAADPSPEWLLAFGYNSTPGPVGGRSRLWWVGCRVGIVDDAGDMLVGLTIRPDGGDDSDKPALLTVRRTDGSEWSTEVSFPRFTHHIGNTYLGEVYLRYVHSDRTVYGYIDSDEQFAVELPGDTMNLSRVPVRTGVVVPRIITRPYHLGYDCLTMPQLTYVAGYTGWTAHDRALHWGLAE